MRAAHLAELLEVNLAAAVGIDGLEHADDVVVGSLGRVLVAAHAGKHRLDLSDVHGTAACRQGVQQRKSATETASKNMPGMSTKVSRRVMWAGYAVCLRGARCSFND